MAQKLIVTGSTPNDKTGDKLRNAFIKVNENFTELYEAGAPIRYHLGDDTQFVDIDPATGMVVIQSGFDTGMPVYIKGANCADGGVGGNVVIEAGGAPLPNNGTTGNIELAAQQTTIESNNNMWSFRDDGVLELPEGGDIVDNNGDSVLGGSGDRLVNGDHEFVLNVSGAGPYISFPADDGSQIQIQGCDITGIGFEVQLVSAEDGVRLSANAGSIARKDWLFGTDGKLTTPDFWRVGNSNTSISNDGFANSSDLWLRAGDALFITTDLIGEGEASDSQWMFSNKVLQLPNGGDIVDSNGDTVLGGTGGWTFDTVTATTNGNIIVKAGSGADAWASLLSNNGANSFWVDDVGAHVTSNFIEGETTENYWTFGTDGKLTFPSGMFIESAMGNALISADPNVIVAIQTNGPDSAAVLAWTDIDPVTSDQKGVSFSTGNGDGSPYAEISVLNHTLSGSAQEWRFNDDGSLTLPTGGDIKNSAGTSVLGATLTLQAKPTTKEGQAGDLKGMIAIDSIGGEFYYCIANYTDGTDPIWAKVAGSTGWI